MPNFLDLRGRCFGRLTALARAPNLGRQTMWSCICACGETSVVASNNLTRGRQVSCGCYMREVSAAIGRAGVVHGHARGRPSRTYVTWIAMIQRCTDKNCGGWDDYGGRGITVCPRWRTGEGALGGFQCFLADMGERPVGTTINRIDNNGNYQPGNCNWATPKEQGRNRRSGKITDQDAVVIRAAKQFGVSTAHLADQYGLHPGYINQLARNARRTA